MRTERLKIGFSFVDLASGGAQTFLVQLAQGMAQRGHQLTFYLTANPKDPVHVDPTLLAVIQFSADPVSRPRQLLASQVVQLDGFHGLRRKLPYLRHLDRCVETFHSIYSLHRSGPLFAQQCVVVSRSVQALLKRPSELIYPGISIPSEPFPQTRHFDVAILGRIHPVKQHLLFFKACEMLLLQRGRLSVLVIGGYPQEDAYQQRVEAEIQRLTRTGMEIHVTGQVAYDRVFQWLLQVRLLLVTSLSEGFGRMAVEAFSCGVPVIANPVGGLLEIIEEAKTGFFARRDNPSSFAALAACLLDDRDLYQRVSLEARSVAQKRFSLEATLDAYEALYRKVALASA